MVDPSDFREAMQQMASSVMTVTTRDQDGTPIGMMATAVTSLSATPPSLVVCVNCLASAHDTFIQVGRMGVSLIPEAATEYAEHFARAKGVDRFSMGNWRDSDNGVPLYADAPVSFDCHIARTLDGYSHTIFIAEIDKIYFAAEEASSCLLWHRQKFVKIS